VTGYAGAYSSHSYENPVSIIVRSVLFITTKEVTEMEEKKEAGASIWVWVIIIAITAAVVAGFIIFLRP
ncbi:MAG: hypothetical protein WBN53_16735, partial [Thermodesulfobacteriota bacterium]